MNGTGVKAIRATLQETVQQRVKQFIIENNHRAGDPLPPEAELARRLGISRPSLREAMRVLQTIGVVESRHGSGTYVGEFRMDTLVDGMSFSIQASSEANALAALSEILEVREVLEGHMVRKCVDEITDTQMEVLDNLVQSMQAKADAGLTFGEEDKAFHETLYEQFHNSLIVQLTRAFWQVYSRVESDLASIDSQLHSVVQRHQDIVDALRKGDKDAAEQAMYRHFDGLRARKIGAES